MVRANRGTDKAGEVTADQEDLEPVELAPTQRRPARTIQSDPPGIPLSVLSSQSVCPSHLSTYLPICL